MGYESDFELEEMEVKAPFESFPTGKLVAFNQANQTTQVLSRFFTNKTIETNSIDFGLFDKETNGKATYSFIRQTG